MSMKEIFQGMEERIPIVLPAEKSLLAEVDIGSTLVSLNKENAHGVKSLLTGCGEMFQAKL